MYQLYLIELLTLLKTVWHVDLGNNNAAVDRIKLTTKVDIPIYSAPLRAVPQARELCKA